MLAPIMTQQQPLPRSPELMSAQDTAVLVVDVQEKIIRLVENHNQIVWNVGRLIDGAGVLGLPVTATEQYPQGLGHTIPELGQRLGNVPSKLTFSCCGCPEIFHDLESRNIHRLLLAGIETHVCVQQTALDLLAVGFQVYVAVDAVGARRSIDHQVALQRIESSGATLTTTEAALFEWCQVSGTPEFKKISALVKQESGEG